MRRVCPLAACLALWLAASVAQGQETLTLSEGLDWVRGAIQAGQVDDAEKVLGLIPPDQVDRNDYDFLRGQIALARNDFDKAIDAFRAVLARDPSLNRVRLDLARSYFLKGDDEAAEYHFRNAQAAGLPPQVQATVNVFLGQIARRKHWTFNVSVGMAPDTNINAATAVKTVTGFGGLPFQVDQSAQKKSGIGLVVNLDGAYQFDMTENSRLVVGGLAVDNDYADHQLDDRSVGAFVGPRFLFGQDSEMTVKAEVIRRWYGGQGYTLGRGMRLDAQTTLSPQWFLSGVLDVQQVSYDQSDLNSGPVGSLSVSLTYGIDATSFVRLSPAIVREQTNTQEFSDTQYFIEANYYKDLPWGFGVIVGANFDLALYDAESGFFGVTRRDRTANYRIGVSNSAVDLFGFSPVLSFVHTDRYSDIPFYSFDRDRVELTMKRNF